MTHLSQASCRSLVSSKSASDVMPCHSLLYGCQWPEGSKWLDIFTRFQWCYLHREQSSNSQACDEKNTRVTCIGFNMQSNLSEYATTCIVTT